MAQPVSFYCEKCFKTQGAEAFYGTKNLEKYPDGKLKQCKKCITMHVNNFEPDTYLWILQECDVPYIPTEWSALLAKYGKDRSKLSGMTILGRYLSKMKLKQFCDFSWKDTAFLQELADAKMEETMKRQGYDAQEIAMAKEQSKVVITPGELKEPNYADEEEDYFSKNEPSDDFENELSDEDRKYLRLKWGKTYKPEEWIRLEQLYEEMMKSYDVQGAGHVDTLKLLCKTSLKANQLIDIGDVEGFQKMSKVYDSLMKSGKFTAAQNKAQSGEYIDSIAQLVEICEKEGFIPRYYTDGPKDRVDETIADLKEYTHSLVFEEMNLGTLIEGAVKQMSMEESKAEDEDNEDELTLDSLDKMKNEIITDQDMKSFYDYEESNELEDAKSIELFLEREDDI